MKIDNNLPILTENLKYRHSQSWQKPERAKEDILDIYSIRIIGIIILLEFTKSLLIDSKLIMR